MARRSKRQVEWLSRRRRTGRRRPVTHRTACPSGLSNYLIGGVLDTDRRHKASSARSYATCSRAGAGRCIRLASVHTFVNGFRHGGIACQSCSQMGCTYTRRPARQWRARHLSGSIIGRDASPPTIRPQSFRGSLRRPSASWNGTEHDQSWSCSGVKCERIHAKLTQAPFRGLLEDCQALEIIGEPGWDRTIDTLIKRAQPIT